MYLCGGDVNGEDCVWEEGVWEIYLLNAAVNLKLLCKKSLKYKKQKKTVMLGFGPNLIYQTKSDKFLYSLFINFIFSVSDDYIFFISSLTKELFRNFCFFSIVNMNQWINHLFF